MDEKTQIASTPLCEAWGRTSIGGRNENQDSYGGLVVGNRVILTVCDGMGGMAGGKTASSTAVDEILNTFAINAESGIRVRDLIKKAICNANAAIYEKAKNDSSLYGMGTTATLVVLTKRAAYLTHVGDSRIYLLHGKKKRFRTFDHSRVFEMVAQGYMTEEQARQSNFSNIITRALGIRDTVEFTVEKIPFHKGDRFLLCSDGVWNMLPEKSMLPLYATHSRAEDNIVALTDLVDKHGQDNGNSHDNLTAVMADIKVNSTYQYSFCHIVSSACHDVMRSIKLKRTKKY